MSATASHDQLLPRPSGGLWRGAALALVAHAALLAALTSAVRWRASPPEAVQAELWSAVPQVAAPAAAPTTAPPPPPPPPPARVVEPAPKPPPAAKVEPAQPDPQIAIAQAKAEKERKAREQAERDKAEKARQEKLERDKAEREKAAREKAARDKAEKDKAEKAERERKEREAADRAEKAERARKAEEDQRRRNIDRLMGQVGGSATGSPGGTAAQSSGPSASYTGKIIGAIKPNIVFTDTVSGNPAAEVEVRAGPSGSIIARRLVRSSGHKEWDEAVLRAIDRTATLPRDVDGRVPPVLTLVFRPQE